MVQDSGWFLINSTKGVKSWLFIKEEFGGMLDGIFGTTLTKYTGTSYKNKIRIHVLPLQIWLITKN